MQPEGQSATEFRKMDMKEAHKFSSAESLKQPCKTLKMSCDEIVEVSEGEEGSSAINLVTPDKVCK